MAEKNKKYYEQTQEPVRFYNRETGVTVAPVYTWVVESYRENQEWEEVAEEAEKVSKANKKADKKSENVAEEVAEAVAGV